MVNNQQILFIFLSFDSINHNKNAQQPHSHMQLLGLFFTLLTNFQLIIRPVYNQSLLKAYSNFPALHWFRIVLFSLYPLTLISHSSANFACVSFCFFLILLRLSLMIYSHFFALTSINLNTDHLKL